MAEDEHDHSGAAPTRELDEARKLAWLRLIRSENVGPITFRNLVNRFGEAAQALEALPALSRRGGLSRGMRICGEEEARAELEAAHAAGIKVIALGEPDYPELLGHVESAPPLLFALGDTSVLRRRIVAIVGSRNCSAAGRRITQRIATGLAEAGYIVASGLARGIDAAAHEASAHSGTVAVMAGGVDAVYPEEHRPLHEALQMRGAAISEMPLGHQPKARDFPRRNRIISGLALGTVIVEAAVRSGSLITARIAAEQGRDVFAVPGSPLDPRAEGTNRLIKDGAILVRDASDVLESLSSLRVMRDRGSPSTPFEQVEEDAEQADWERIAQSERDRVVEALGPAPVEVDEIVRHTGLPAATVQVVLLELELAGRLARHGGHRVSLI